VHTILEKAGNIQDFWNFERRILKFSFMRDASMKCSTHQSFGFVFGRSVSDAAFFRMLGFGGFSSQKRNLMEHRVAHDANKVADPGSI